MSPNAEETEDTKYSWTGHQLYNTRARYTLLEPKVQLGAQATYPQRRGVSNKYKPICEEAAQQMNVPVMPALTPRLASLT